MKTPRPWYRSQTDTWYVCRHGKQVPLAKGKANKPAAQRAYFRLMAEGGDALPPPTRLAAAHVCDLFLDWSKKHNGGRTYEWYRSYLQSFCEAFGAVHAAELKPFHVTLWLDAHPGWTTSRRCAVTAVKRAFNWAAGEGLLTSNPLQAVRKPPAVARQRTLTAEERNQILAAIKDRQFRDFVFALQETGCRPSEVARVTAAHVDLGAGVWLFPPEEHKTGKRTGKPRVVYLTPAMVALTSRLVAEHPEGPLFRGPRGGRPFSRNAIRCRFRNLRKKLPHRKGVVAYTYRHSYATDALERGVGLAEVAELLSHTGTEKLMRHYQHLGQRRAHLRRAAVKATRSPGGECG
jgi:integrase